jgi:hypothetical protein
MMICCLLMEMIGGRDRAFDVFPAGCLRVYEKNLGVKKLMIAGGAWTTPVPLFQLST